MAPQKDKDEVFNSLSCIDIVKFNWATSTGQAIPTWNGRVQDFLKYHLNLRFVDRTLPRGQRQLMPFIKTFACSLFFHGFFHGFTSFFTGLAISEAAAKAFSSTKLCERISNRIGDNTTQMIARIIT